PIARAPGLLERAGGQILYVRFAARAKTEKVVEPGKLVPIHRIPVQVARAGRGLGQALGGGFLYGHGPIYGVSAAVSHLPTAACALYSLKRFPPFSITRSPSVKIATLAFSGSASKLSSSRTPGLRSAR